MIQRLKAAPRGTVGFWGTLSHSFVAWCLVLSIYNGLFVAKSLFFKSFFSGYSIQVTLFKSFFIKSLSFKSLSITSLSIKSLFFKSLFSGCSFQVTLFDMLSKILAGSIVALSVGKALARVQFGGINIAG